MSLNKFAVAILREAADTIEARAQQYQGVGDMFADVGKLADVSPETALDVLVAVKATRLAHNPEHHDSLVDLVAYFALKSCYGRCGAAGNERDADWSVSDSVHKKPCVSKEPESKTQMSKEEMMGIIESQRLQLSACITAAMSDTRKSMAAQRIGQESPAWSIVYEKICDKIEDLIEARERIATLSFSRMGNS